MPNETTSIAWKLMDLLRGEGIESGIGQLLRLVWIRRCQPDIWDRALEGFQGHEPTAIRDVVEATTASEVINPAALGRAATELDGVPIGLLPELFEELLSLRYREVGRYGQEHASPEWLSQLQIALLEPMQGEVNDPACGLGGSLLAAARAGASRVSGREINNDSLQTARMRLEIHGIEADLEAGDSFTAPLHRPVDRIIADPPLGLRLTSPQTSRWGGAVAVSDDVGAWLSLVSDALDDGMAAVLVSSEGLGRSKRFTEFVQRGVVEAVFMLPTGALAATNIRSSVVVLQGRSAPRTAVLVVDLASFFETPEHGQNFLGAEGVETATSLMRQWRAREFEPGAAPAHVALTLTREHIAKFGFLPQFPAAPDKPLALPDPAARLLTQVRITDLKALRGSHQVPLAPLTLVYGPNSAGKSSIIQSLLLVAQSAREGDFTANGHLADLGAFPSLVSDHDIHRGIRVGLDFGAVPPWPAASGSLHPRLVRSVDVEFRSYRGADAYPAAAWVGVRGSTPLAASRDDDTQTWNLDSGTLDDWAALLGTTDAAFLDPRRHRKAVDRRHALQGALARLRRLPDLKVTAEGGSILPREVSMPTTTLGRIDPKDDLEQRLSRALRCVDDELRRLAEGLVYLGPIRPAPERFSQRISGAQGPNYASYLYDNDSALAKVNEWLGIIGIPYSLRILPVSVGGSTTPIGDLVAVVLTDLRSGVDVSPADVGYGISQVLPIVVECLRNTERVICIEQPELHLHPRLQSKVAELMVEATSLSGAANQIIAETHSEHMLLRLQRMVREGAIDPDDVAIIYVDQDAAGAVEVQRLRLGGQGEFLDPWPTGFFDDTLEDLLEGWQ